MFSWLTFFITIGLALVLLIPLGVYRIIVYIRDVFLPNTFSNASAEQAKIEDDIINKNIGVSYELLKEKFHKSPEWEKASKTYHRSYKLRDKIYTHCNGELNGKTWIYHVLVLLPTFVGTILSIAIICMVLISAPIEIYQYTHWDKKYTHYMSMEHPTYNDCKEAEEANADLKGLMFIKKEYIDKCELINTEELWSRFYSNVKVYTDTLEGSLLRLAEAENKLANTLDNFKK